MLLAESIHRRSDGGMADFYDAATDARLPDGNACASYWERRREWVDSRRN
jgi:hypothetical protein